MNEIESDGSLGPLDPAELRSTLLGWFDAAGRPLPWRLDRTVYGTWISEMMLQQTTVQTVIPYWHRFMERFPDVGRLAAADETEVLALWAGLGYYRRARMLHRAAGLIVNEGGGRFPQDRQGWQALPGVGAYASGAIASIALGERTPALDANAKRVITRWSLGNPELLPSLTPRRLEAVADDLVAPDRPGDWNEAVMELGALVCRAGQPACSGCPVVHECRAGQSGSAALIPAPKVAVGTSKVRLAMLVVAWGDHFLLTSPGHQAARLFPHGPAPAREDFTGLHQGLWGLPMSVWLPVENQDSPPWAPVIWKPWMKEKGLDLDPAMDDLLHLGTFAHAITKYRLQVEVYGMRLPEAFCPAPGLIADKKNVRGGQIWTSNVHKQGNRREKAVFLHFDENELPISKLADKGLALAQKSIC